MRKQEKGFTLVELAVVIAIVAILAAVAIPRLLDTADSAEEAVARDFQSQLISAASMWTAKNSRTPQGFTDFVKQTPIVQGDLQTISTSTLGPDATANPCSVTVTNINCDAAFPNLSSAQFNWVEGSVSANIVRQ